MKKNEIEKRELQLGVPLGTYLATLQMLCRPDERRVRQSRDNTVSSLVAKGLEEAAEILERYMAGKS